MTDHDDFLNSVQIYTGTEDAQSTTPKDLIASGSTMLQTKTQYHTAISVQKPRDLDKVVSNVMNEARYAGEEWYYAWAVKSKEGGRKNVEGGSVGLAFALVREWGNCVVDVEYEVQAGQDVFTARFVDLERGSTFTRMFKQKQKSAVGNYDAERWQDMEFQKAQSKALRNVILAGIPRWLQKAAIEEAKKGVVSSIERVGIAKSRQLAVDFLAGYGVEQKQIEELLHKKKDSWTSEDVAKLRGIAAQLREGQVAADEIFIKSNDAKPIPAPQEAQPKRSPGRPKKETAPPAQPNTQERIPDEEMADRATLLCSQTGEATYVDWCKDNCPEHCYEYNEATKE